MPWNASGTWTGSPAVTHITDEVTGAHSGQVDGELGAHGPKRADGSSILGVLSYTIFDDEAHVRMLQVIPSAQRKGVATALVQALRDLGYPVRPGYATGEGDAFWKATQKESFAGLLEDADSSIYGAGGKWWIGPTGEVISVGSRGEHSSAAQHIYPAAKDPVEAAIRRGYIRVDSDGDMYWFDLLRWDASAKNRIFDFVTSLPASDEKEIEVYGPDPKKIIWSGTVRDVRSAKIYDSKLMEAGGGYLSQLIKTFGRTDNPRLGGWILPEGDFLDLSAGSGMRADDHRAINQVLRGTSDRFDSRYAAMMHIARQNQMIRWSPEAWSAELATKPTPAQRKTLEYLASVSNRYGRLTVEGPGGFERYYQWDEADLVSEDLRRKFGESSSTVLSDLFEGLVDLSSGNWNSRFFYEPKTAKLSVMGNILNAKTRALGGSHAEDWFALTGSNRGFDALVRGWVGRGGKYKFGVIHFAPADTQGVGYGALEEFVSQYGATANTLVRSYGNVWEQPLGGIIGILSESLHGGIGDLEEEIATSSINEIAVRSVWYHCTQAANVPSIARQGLMPNLTGDAHWGGNLGVSSYNKVFLAPTKEQAIQYGIIIFKNHLEDGRADLPILLMITTPPTVVSQLQHTGEGWLQQKIPPSAISVRWQGQWRPIRSVASLFEDDFHYNWNAEVGEFEDWEGSLVGSINQAVDDVSSLTESKESFAGESLHREFGGLIEEIVARSDGRYFYRIHPKGDMRNVLRTGLHTYTPADSPGAYVDVDGAERWPDQDEDEEPTYRLYVAVNQWDNLGADRFRIRIPAELLRGLEKDSLGDYFVDSGSSSRQVLTPSQFDVDMGKGQWVRADHASAMMVSNWVRLHYKAPGYYGNRFGESKETSFAQLITESAEKAWRFDEAWINTKTGNVIGLAGETHEDYVVQHRQTFGVTSVEADDDDGAALAKAFKNGWMRYTRSGDARYEVHFQAYKTKDAKDSIIEVLSVSERVGAVYLEWVTGNDEITTAETILSGEYW